MLKSYNSFNTVSIIATAVIYISFFDTNLIVSNASPPGTGGRTSLILFTILSAYQVTTNRVPSLSSRADSCPTRSKTSLTLLLEKFHLSYRTSITMPTAAFLPSVFPSNFALSIFPCVVFLLEAFSLSNRSLLINARLLLICKPPKPLVHKLFVVNRSTTSS